MTREQVAQLRIKAAAEHVENAQHELERAVSALAALNFMSPEMDKVSRLRDRLHEAWYRLAPLSHVRAKACAKASLDREVEAGDEDPHRGCCPAGPRFAKGGIRVFSGAPGGPGPAAGSTPAVSTTPPMFRLICPGDCPGAVHVARESVDVTTSGVTDRECRRCGALLILNPPVQP